MYKTPSIAALLHPARPSSRLQVRPARLDDWATIEMLYQHARRRTPRLWWWEEYLHHPLFLVTEQRNEQGSGQRNERGDVLVGALFAWADDSPVAWVRLAVLADSLPLDRWFDAALPVLTDRVQRFQGSQTLAWMDHDGWAANALRRRGFIRWEEVITMEITLPHREIRSTSDVILRPAVHTDLDALVTIDHAAFSPHWWQSSQTLARRLPASTYFSVACACEQGGQQVVAYIEGGHQETDHAHINRVAVHPDWQGVGIGARLMNSTLNAFRQSGVRTVSLNTQRSNRRAQRLYHRLGFRPTGETTTVWVLDL